MPEAGPGLFKDVSGREPATSGPDEVWADHSSHMWYGISVAVGILVVVALATWFIRGRRA